MVNCKLFSRNKESGFTFIELILYTALVSIFLTSAVYFAWNVIYSQVKSTVQQEVSENLRFISGRIQAEIRNAQEINNVGTSSIELDSGLIGITTISLVGQTVQITQSGQTSDLSSDKVEVTELLFTNLTSGDQKTKNVKFSLALRYKNSNDRQEWDKEGIVETTVELRSN